MGANESSTEEQLEELKTNVFGIVVWFLADNIIEPSQKIPPSAYMGTAVPGFSDFKSLEDAVKSLSTYAISKPESEEDLLRCSVIKAYAEKKILPEKKEFLSKLVEQLLQGSIRGAAK
jgi:hypothetical protein